MTTIARIQAQNATTNMLRFKWGRLTKDRLESEMLDRKQDIKKLRFKHDYVNFLVIDDLKRHFSPLPRDQQLRILDEWCARASFIDRPDHADDLPGHLAMVVAQAQVVARWAFHTIVELKREIHLRGGDFVTLVYKFQFVNLIVDLDGFQGRLERPPDSTSPTSLGSRGLENSMHAPGSSVAAEVLELLTPQSIVPTRSPTPSGHLRPPHASLNHTTSSTGAYTNTRYGTRARPRRSAQNRNDSHEAMSQQRSERALLERRFRQCNEILQELEPPQANDVDGLALPQLRHNRQIAAAGPSTATRVAAVGPSTATRVAGAGPSTATRVAVAGPSTATQIAAAGPSTATRTVAPDTHDHRQALQEVARRSTTTDPRSTSQSGQSNARTTGSNVALPPRPSHARNAKSKVGPGFYASNRKWR